MKKEIIRQIGEAYWETPSAFYQDESGVRLWITDEYDHASDIRTIDRVVKKIIQTHEGLFSIKCRKKEQYYIEGTEIGKKFLLLLKINPTEISRHFPMHKFNPYFALFVQSVTDQNLWELSPWIESGADKKKIQTWMQILNDCVDSIRKEGVSKKFKASLANLVRNSNKNYSQLLRYIDGIFERYSRILVLRIDFGYQVNCSPVNINGEPNHWDVRKHWRLFLKFLETKIPSKVGYAWKLEYGLDKGFHYHALIVLDGAKVREDITYAKMLGEHWRNIVTEGRGLYYNCNSNKSGYRYCGIGMINHTDTQLREGLKKAALYLTKMDYFIKVVMPGGGRAFGKGELSKLSAVRLGRPRQIKN